MSQGDDHCYEARGNGDGKEDWAVYDGSGSRGSTIVTSVGELFVFSMSWRRTRFLLPPALGDDPHASACRRQSVYQILQRIYITF